MSRVFLNNNAINQKGTPLLYTDIFANRPQYGIKGRLFFSIDSQQIFEDNGTSWLLLANATGSLSGYVPYVGALDNLNMGLFNITATNFNGGGTGLTSLPTNTSLYPTLNQNTTGTAANITASSNNTITTLSLLSLPYSQVSGTPSLAGFVPYTGATTGLNLGSFGITANSLTLPSFTTGSVLFAGAAGLIGQDNTNFYWDDTNNRLGIQTNAPAASLDVHNNVAGTTTVQLNNTATSNTYIAFQKNSVGYWRIGNTAAANSFDLLNNSLSNTAFTINNATNAAQFNRSLTVTNTDSDNHLIVVGATSPSLRINNALTGATQQVGIGLATSTNNFIQGSVNGNFCIFNSNTTSSPILFGIWGTINTIEAARITAARNFLIGTTVDNGYKLDVTGNVNITGNLTVSGTSPNSSIIVLNIQTASYTMVLSDAGKLIQMNVSTANNLTIPLNASVPFAIGQVIELIQEGTGQTNVLAIGGVVIKSYNSFVKLSGQYAAATLTKIATDTWYLIGNLSA
jgi:hypothetical protein